MTGDDGMMLTNAVLHLKFLIFIFLAARLYAGSREDYLCNLNAGSTVK